MVEMKREAKLEQDLRQACESTLRRLSALDRSTWKPSETLKGTQLWRPSIGFVDIFKSTTTGFQYVHWY